MTKIKDLIADLATRNPEAQAFFMTTRKQPFENRIVGVVGREEMFDQRWRVDEGIAPDDVFLVVGKRLRPGSYSAWIVAEHRANHPDAPRRAFVGADDAQMDAEIAHIVESHLDVAPLDEEVGDMPGFRCVQTSDLQGALEAAYRAGGAAARDAAVAPEPLESPEHAE